MPLRLLLIAVVLTSSCSRSDPPLRPCPREAPAPPALPHQRPRHLLPGYWLRSHDLARTATVDAKQIEAHNRRMRSLEKDGWPTGRWDLLALEADEERVAQHIRQRLRALSRAAERGKRVLEDGRPPQRLLARLRRQLEQIRPARELRIVTVGAPVRCYPTKEGLHGRAWELAFDLNACGWFRFGEPVRVLAKLADFWFVRSTYAEGWVRPARLSAPLDDARARAFVEPSSFVVVQVDRLPVWADPRGERLLGTARLGLRLPLTAVEGAAVKVVVPTTEGLGAGWLLGTREISFGHPPLTRHALLTTAFGLLDTPYGWGGAGGNRDCSRLVMDLFQAYGVALPRTTWMQQEAGTRRIDVGRLDPAAKARVIEEASRRAVVLLYLPGHIGLYLGRDGGRQHALHLFSGYLRPCPGGGETMLRINRTTVTALDLGRGSSRRSFIERVTRLVLFELTPPAVTAPAPPTRGGGP